MGKFLKLPTAAIFLFFILAITVPVQAAGRELGFEGLLSTTTAGYATETARYPSFNTTGSNTGESNQGMRPYLGLRLATHYYRFGLSLQASLYNAGLGDTLGHKLLLNSGVTPILTTDTGNFTSTQNTAILGHYRFFRFGRREYLTLDAGVKMRAVYNQPVLNFAYRTYFASLGFTFEPMIFNTGWLELTVPVRANFGIPLSLNPGQGGTDISAGLRLQFWPRGVFGLLNALYSDYALTTAVSPTVYSQIRQKELFITVSAGYYFSLADYHLPAEQSGK